MSSLWGGHAIGASVSDAALPKALAVGAKALRSALALCRSAADLYQNTDDASRTLILQVLFVTLYIDKHADVTEAVPTPIVEDILQAYADGQHEHDLAGSHARRATQAPTTENPRQSEGSDRLSLSNYLRGVELATVSSKRVMVELRGFEPLAFSLRRPSGI